MSLRRYRLFCIINRCHIIRGLYRVGFFIEIVIAIRTVTRGYAYLHLPTKPFSSNRLSLIHRSNSKSELFFLLSILAAASLPTKYLVLGFSDLIAFKMTSATCVGEEVCLNPSLAPSDIFLDNSAYGESEFIAV